MYLPGKYHLIRPFMRYAGVKTKNIHGVRMQLDLSDLIQRHIYYGIYEERELAWIRKYIRPGMTVLDIGANIGYFTGILSRMVGNSGRVFAFEPSPYAFEKLEKMIRQNCLTNVQALPFGLGQREAKVNLYLDSSFHNHTPTMLSDSSHVYSKVMIKSLDSVIAEFNLHQIGFMKIDVEGYEGRILRGGMQALQSGTIQAIMCEFDDYQTHRTENQGYNLEEIFKEYHYTQIHPHPDSHEAKHNRNRFFVLGSANTSVCK